MTLANIIICFADHSWVIESWGIPPAIRNASLSDTELWAEDLIFSEKKDNVVKVVYVGIFSTE